MITSAKRTKRPRNGKRKNKAICRKTRKVNVANEHKRMRLQMNFRKIRLNMSNNNVKKRNTNHSAIQSHELSLSLGYPPVRSAVISLIMCSRRL